MPFVSVNEKPFGRHWGKALKKVAVTSFSEQIKSAFKEKRSVIFLCGPTLTDLTKPGAQLRLCLKNLLEEDGFDVVLGEDDGLEELRLKFHGYAHQNELDFIRGHVNAVVLVADSVGSFCELGLFAYDKSRGDDNQTDFILILNRKFQGEKSYINEGPAAAAKDYGMVIQADFDNFDPNELIARLRRRRYLFVTKN